MPVHCGDQMQLGLCLGYVPALAYGSCRVSDQGTTLRASDLHNARFLIPLLFVLHKPLDEFPYQLFAVDYTVASCKLVRVLFVNDHWWHMWHNRCFDYFCVLFHMIIYICLKDIPWYMNTLFFVCVILWLKSYCFSYKVPLYSPFSHGQRRHMQCVWVCWYWGIGGGAKGSVYHC